MRSLACLLLLPLSFVAIAQSVPGGAGAGEWGIQLGAGGRPNFTPSGVPADSLWDDLFTLPDLCAPAGVGAVSGLAADSSRLYVVGGLVGAGKLRTSGVVAWDGTAWASLGSGVRPEEQWGAYAVAAGGGNVYVGGMFSSIDMVPASSIARWSGTSWSPLGSGVTGGWVYAIAVQGTNVYVGGSFTSAGGLPALGIARWNGTRWDTLGSGLDGTVYAIAIRGGEVIVGGRFSTAGGVAAMNVARWNGVRWDSLGSGVGNTIEQINALAVIGSDLYAGGQFSTAGGTAASNVARWSGTAWLPLGSGTNGAVLSLAVSGTDLAVGGRFARAGSDSSWNIARWNGSSWAPFARGVGGGGGLDRVAGIAVFRGALHVGGEFAIPTPAGEGRSIARWDGTSWAVLHGPGAHRGSNGFVYAVASQGENVYVGGTFTAMGGIPMNRIARWDGSRWHEMGSGMNNNVYAIAIRGDTVFAGGNFTRAGDVNATYVAQWNGTSWSPLGAGVNNAVRAMAVDGSNLYVGGLFTTAGGAPALRVAKWNGTNWSAIGSGIDEGPLVNAVAVVGTDFYVGGLFGRIGGVSGYNNIAKWNGSTWSQLAGGLPQGQYNVGVTSLAASGSTLIAGGDFALSGGRNKIARWNGSSWSAFGSGLGSSPTNTVYAVAVRDSVVYAGGSFPVAPGAYNVARWNGSSWGALGSGVSYAHVSALGVNGGNVYVGGGFILAGDKVGSHVSRWFGPPLVTFQPASGGVGSSVTIRGGEFDLTPSNNLVKFGSVSATVTSAALGTLRVIVPPGATTAPISVTTRNLTGVSSTSFVVSTTGVHGEAEELPAVFALGQNYPNPFNPATTITYDLPVDTRVRLTVYDLLGRAVAVVADAEQSAGSHAVQFDAASLAGGVYIYRLEAGSFAGVRKMLLLK